MSNTDRNTALCTKHEAIISATITYKEQILH